MPPRTGETSSERCLLQALIAAPTGLTRADLQERTGLSPATLVTHLRKPEAAGATAGRLLSLVDIVEDESRVDRYRLRSDAAFLLGIDLGRDQVRVGIGDALGNVLKHPTDKRRWEKIDETVQVDQDPWHALDRAAEMAAEITREVEQLNIADRDRFAGIGVSVTAAIEPDSGMFRPGRTADAWEGLRVVTELKQRLERRGLGCPLVLDKDSNHCATAYSRSQRGQNIRDFVFVKWSQGLSAGLVLGGRLQRGVRGSAGAFGHSPIVRVLDKDDETENPPSYLWGPDPDVRCARCRKQDCLEAIVGTNRLRRVVAEKNGLNGKDKSTWPLLADVQKSALEDHTSNENLILRAAAKRLGNTLGTVTNLLNPQQIIIGGLFGREHSDLLNDRIRQGLRDVSTAPAYRDVDVQFTDIGIIDGTIASVITSGTLASFLLSS
ncbi:MAG: ROK family transcriptional regulator [Solirubrobacteraceae bacterium]